MTAEKLILEKKKKILNLKKKTIINYARIVHMYCDTRYET